MRILREGTDLDGFFRAVGGAQERVLMLDYDGTLAPFREARDEAVPYPGIRPLLGALVSAGHTRVVVVSGRALEDLHPLLDVEPEPEMWGSHGWEHRRPGRGAELEDPGPRARDGLRRGLEDARRRAPAGAVEVKPVSVAVHVRGMGDRAGTELVRTMRSCWSRIAGEAGLELHDFDGGLELRAPGRDKGTAVEAILSGSAPDARAAYLGDDLTDEDAFRTLRGRGLSVLVRDRLRDTAADLWIRPPDELIAFLERWNSAATAE